MAVPLRRHFAIWCSLPTLLMLGAITVAADVAQPVTGLANRPQSEERLSFQTQHPYRPRVHLNADVAMVYGIDKSLPERIKSWRDKGYTVHVMTGVAWGEYQDYYF